MIVIDAGATLDERMLAIFARSDTVVLPVDPGDPGAQRGPPAARPADRDGRDRRPDAVRAQQHVRQATCCGGSDIETALGASIGSDLPYDPLVYLQAANEGDPDRARAARSRRPPRFRELADAVLGKSVVPVAASMNGTEPAPKKERRGLFGRR